MKGIVTFSVSPPAPESSNSTPVHPVAAFEGGWRSGASLSGMSVTSPFSPTVMKTGETIPSSGNMDVDPSGHHQVGGAGGGGAIVGDAHLTLSYLGLGASPLHPTTPKFILPESAVKRVPTTMVSRPVPIGSLLNPKGNPPPGLNTTFFPGPVNTSATPANSTLMNNGYHMQALFPENPFMPGIELSSFANQSKISNLNMNNNTNSFGIGTGFAGGHVHQSAQVPTATSSFDALFARLTPYQQSMVSPVVNPGSTQSRATFLIPRDRDENAPPNQFFKS